MGKSRSKPHPEEIIEAREAAGEPKPKRRRKAKGEEPAPISEPPDAPQDTGNGHAEAPFDPGSFAAKLGDGRPSFAPIPDGFRNKTRFEGAGIRVNQSTDYGRTTAGVQFAETHGPSREEKDALEIAGIKYGGVTGSRQWERQDRENPVANLLDVERVAAELAQARGEGRGR